MPRRILLIDDQPMQYRLTQTFFGEFRSSRFELDWAESYEAGLSRLLKGEHAACLLDYQLGPRDGLQLVREAVARGSRTPIIFLTADSSERVNIEALEAGAFDYLIKGEITPQSLERSLRYALKLGETLGALRQMATHDELTGLINRREFHCLVTAEQERARAEGKPLALVVADVDHFKTLNDRFGHLAGDAILREVARRLRSSVRTGDEVARIGGDEFALVLPSAGRDDAVAVAKRAAAAVAGEPFEAAPGSRVTVTLSAGVAVSPDAAAAEEALFAAADKALYAAKNGGRNGVVAADRSP
jgi:diguanylate cyclase (GGDEF)-like protein